MALAMAEVSMRDETVTTAVAGGPDGSHGGPVGTRELESAMDTLARFVSGFKPACWLSAPTSGSSSSVARDGGAG